VRKADRSLVLIATAASAALIVISLIAARV
jgi:hypothetical protein